MEKKVLIIGAGIAGLAAGSYLQRNGFSTEIFEAHDRPGGLCTDWTRKGYRFDGCIHWLMGSSPRTNMHHLWKELGAGDLEYIEWDVYTVIKLSGGDAFTVYTDPERFGAELLRLGPDDGPLIRRIVRGIRSVQKGDMPAAMDKMGPGELLKLLPALPGALSLFGTWMRTPVSGLIARFRSPRLKEAFSLLFGPGMADFPVAGLFMMLGFMAKRCNGYPLGGSAAFAQAIADRYLALGGNIRYGRRVDQVLVEDGRAVGLRWSSGEARGDYVVSAADAQDALDRLLGGRFRDPGLDRAFASLRPYPSLIFASFGVAGSLSRFPHSYSFPLAEPILLEDGALRLDRLSLRIQGFDPSSAPAGKTAVTVMVPTYNFEYWQGLRTSDPSAYKAAKERTAELLLSALDAEMPGFRAMAETVDIATPATFHRYTGNAKGSFEGWLPTLQSMGRKLPRTLPGLSGFYMVGQWLNPGGGLPPCAMDGRGLARRLCKLEGRRFTAD